MRTPLLAGNWKMNGSRRQAAELVAGIIKRRDEVSHLEIAVFPPFLYIPEVKRQEALKVGAQNVSNQDDGAFTGEVSISMLKDFNCDYVIVGHSERRHLYDESNQVVAEKFTKVMSKGIAPILCVGETLEQWQAGDSLKIVQEQLAEVLRLKDNLPSLSSMVIAYEPVWAIGTGQSATPEYAQSVHEAIRQSVNDAVPGLGDAVRILYGGSVKPDNAAMLFEMPDIDGALVGGASLDANSFIEIGKKWIRF